MPTVLILLLLIFISIYLRIQIKQRSEAYEVPEHAKPSPFSEALQELVAHAGGIYLSLVLLVSFLHIELADKWSIAKIEMEPLALMSIVLAILQPIALKTYRTIKGS